MQLIIIPSFASPSNNSLPSFLTSFLVFLFHSFFTSSLSLILGYILPSFIHLFLFYFYLAKFYLSSLLPSLYFSLCLPFFISLPLLFPPILSFFTSTNILSFSFPVSSSPIQAIQYLCSLSYLTSSFAFLLLHLPFLILHFTFFLLSWSLPFVVLDIRNRFIVNFLSRFSFIYICFSFCSLPPSLHPYIFLQVYFPFHSLSLLRLPIFSGSLFIFLHPSVYNILQTSLSLSFLLSFQASIILATFYFQPYPHLFSSTSFSPPFHFLLSFLPHSFLFSFPSLPYPPCQVLPSFLLFITLLPSFLFKKYATSDFLYSIIFPKV